MRSQQPIKDNDFDGLVDSGREAEGPSDQDLWFLPGPMEDEPNYLAPGIRAESAETSILADWTQAEAVLAARLARVAARLGALDERLGV